MNAKVFIIRTEYGYAVSPSPVVVPGRKAALDFENLSGVKAKVFVPGAVPAKLELPRHRSGSVTLSESNERVIFYKVEMKGELLARGNSAPIIIRDARNRTP